MCTKILQSAKAILLISSIVCSSVVSAQQYVTNNKDVTRPEISEQFNSGPAVTVANFRAERFNGYNQLQWETLKEYDTRKFIVEFTSDGINYKTAGELSSTTGAYQLKHHTFEATPLLYRLRIEGLDGKFNYSQTIFINGSELLPVKIYPTIISGNSINVIASFPVERIAVFSGSGQQVYVQDVGGKRDYIAVSLPSLGRGMYWMSFTGQGWRTSSKFIVQ